MGCIGRLFRRVLCYSNKGKGLVKDERWKVFCGFRRLGGLRNIIGFNAKRLLVVW